MEPTLEEKFEKARTKLVMFHPFFAHLMMSLPFVITDGESEKQVRTAATDSKQVMFGREFCDKLTPDELIGVMLHEILHAAYGHCLLFRRGYRDPKIWNYAADFVVNLIIKQNNLKIPDKCLLDDKYKDMSTEEVYDILIKDAEEVMVNVLGDDLIDSGMSESEQKQQSQTWAERVLAAAQVATQQGKLPAGMDRFIDDIANPRIPWYEFLDNLVGEALRDDYAFERSDRRFLQQGIYLPDLYNEGAMVAVAIDTSGSIGEDELRIFLSEALGILGSKNVTRIRLMSCDAAIGFDKIVSPDSPIPSKLGGGGGTDFRPVFNRLEKSKEKPQLLVYLTDLMGTFPKSEPEYPVIWVTKEAGNNVQAPWGIQIDFNPTTEEIKTFQANGSDHGDSFDMYDDPEDDSYEPEEFNGDY